MKKITLIVIAKLAMGAITLASAKDFSAGKANFSVSDQGVVDSITNGEKEYIYKNGSPFLQIQLEGSELFLQPTKAVFKEINDFTTEVILSYEGGEAVKLQLIEKKHHLKCLIIDTKSTKTISKVVWGPYKTKMMEEPAGILGALHSNGFSFIMRSLNFKTIGGTDPLVAPAVPDTGKFNGDNTSLEAFSKDRTKETVKDAWVQLKIKRMAIPGETVKGSSIALLGCEKKDILDTMLLLEKAENLPSPVLKGQWGKKSWFARSTRMMMNFSEANIDDCIAIAKASGTQNIYHPGIFSSWGNWKLTGEFPNGYAGVKACVEKAKKEGVTLGVHTLSSFITTSDAYVTPKPHPNLAVAAVTKLSRSLDAESGDIYLADGTDIEIYRKQSTNGSYDGPNSHKVIRIGDELIYFDKVSEGKPWILKDCQRGWNKTEVSEHQKDATVARVISHPYQVFFPDIHLQKEMAEKLADFFNQTGLERISFDGLEGCQATGHGQYACNHFVKSFFDKLENKNIVMNSSIMTNYAWHTLTNQSWGEPHYGEWRASQIEHRFNSVRLLKNNYIPYKLGQYIFKDASLADINWLMGVSTGHEAGVDLYVPVNALSTEKGKQKLQAIKNWTEYRKSGRMTPVLSKQLQNQLYEFTLKADKNGVLNPVFVKQWKKLEGAAKKSEKLLVKMSDLSHVSRMREPGQPTNASWNLSSAGGKQPFTCQVTADKEGVSVATNPVFKLGAKSVTWKGSLKAGEYLHFTETTIDHYRGNKKLSSQEFEPLFFGPGSNILKFDYTRADKDADGIKLKVDILTPGVGIMDYSTSEIVSLATGKPVVATHNKHKGFLVTDGYKSDRSAFWETDLGGKPPHGAVTIKLANDADNTVEVGRVVVYTYYDSKRAYQFFVEGSAEGDNWKMLADYSENEKTATLDGYEIKFNQTEIRQLRIRMIRNTVNSGVHLLEVSVYEK